MIYKARFFVGRCCIGALFFLLLMQASFAYALPVGNPGEATMLYRGAFREPCCEDYFALRGGFYGDYVFDRHMRLKDSPQSYINTTELHTNAVYVDLNFCDRFDFFTTLGISWMNIIANELLFEKIPAPTASPVVDITTKTDFSWSVGARATLWNTRGCKWGVEAQYFNYSPENIKYINGEYTPNNSDNINFNFRYTEWQVGTGISYCLLDWLIPYVAVQYANARVRVNSVTTTSVFPNYPFTMQDLKAARHWGGTIGVTLIGCGYMALTVEGRFCDEDALYVNAQMRF